MFDRMKSVIRSCSGRRPGWLIVVAILATTGLTVSASTWLSAGATRVRSFTAPAALRNSAPVQEQGVIRLLTSGFSPAEVSGTAGQYRLVATRPSEDDEVRFQLRRESGELIEEFVMPQEKVDWTRLVELESGSYRLSVNGHPDWVCHITAQ